MSADEKSDNQAGANKIIFPDLAELWKELYFKTENAWAQAWKDIISTDTFVKMLDQTMNQHLSMEKITRQNLDKIFEHSTAPSKKDLARIAELVISVEEKVDDLDCRIGSINNIGVLPGLLKTLEAVREQLTAAEVQHSRLQNQIEELLKQNSQLHVEISTIQKQLADALPGSIGEAASKPKRRKKEVNDEQVKQGQ